MELPPFFPYFLVQGHALLIEYVYIAENFSLIQKMFYLIAEKFQKNSFESIIDGKLPSNGNQFLTKYHINKELNLHNILIIIQLIYQRNISVSFEYLSYLQHIM